MKDLLSKEHYCYKIHTLLIKSSASPFFYRQPSYIEYPNLHFYKEILISFFYDFSKLSTPLWIRWGVGTMKTDGAKISAKPPALRSFLPTDRALEINIKLSHYIAFMWENCVIGNPLQLNSCEYGWERNEGEKFLRSIILQTGIKTTWQSS